MHSINQSFGVMSLSEHSIGKGRGARILAKFANLLELHEKYSNNDCDNDNEEDWNSGSFRSFNAGQFKDANFHGQKAKNKCDKNETGGSEGYWKCSKYDNEDGKSLRHPQKNGLISCLNNNRNMSSELTVESGAEDGNNSIRREAKAFPGGCFNCGKAGHWSKECPNEKSVRRTRGCFKCGEQDHIAKDCSQDDSSIIEKNGKVRELYVPPDNCEVLDDEESYIPTGINFEKYDKIKVEVTGTDVPNAMQTFASANFSPVLVRNIQRARYVKPTPVQKYTIPIVEAGRDLMACAQTGSGKTAAFLLPIIQMMLEAPDLPDNTYEEVQKPWAVIVSPTRELAIQIQKEALRFSRDSLIKVEVVYGGTVVTVQAHRVIRGCHILVATPGRLQDFLQRNKLSFTQVKVIILDEGDRLLDLGFGPVVKSFMENSTMPPKYKRQTLLFSATFPVEVQKMALEFLKADYLFLRVGTVGAANMDVIQTVLQVPRFEKRDMLLQIIQESDNNRILIFVETRRQADFVASFLSQKDYVCTSIHGNRLQREREEALNDFRAGRKSILTATTVAARGLDIKDVHHVINYDMPRSIHEYVHRIGRTGRVGNLGLSTSFFDPSVDSMLASDLVRILANAQQEVPDWLVSLADDCDNSGRSNFLSQDFRKDKLKSSRQDDMVLINNDDSW